MNKSADAFRTIREVADWLGVAAHVLRFWESKFTQVKPVKRAGGRRYYRPSDMQLLGGIKVLLHDRGMTVRGVQRLLREEGTTSVAALSPPLEALEASPDLVEGIGEEAPWLADAEAERSHAADRPEAALEDEPEAEDAPEPVPSAASPAPEPPPSLPGFGPSDLQTGHEAASGESQAEKAAARLAELAATEDAPDAGGAVSQPPDPSAPEPEAEAEAEGDPMPEAGQAPAFDPEPESDHAETPDIETELASGPESETEPDLPPASGPRVAPDAAPEPPADTAVPPEPEPGPEPEPEIAAAPEPETAPDAAPEPEFAQAPASEPIFASARNIDRAPPPQPAAEAAPAPASAPPIRVEGAGLDALAAFASGAANLPPERRARLGPSLSALRALRVRIGAPVAPPGGTGAP